MSIARFARVIACLSFPALLGPLACGDDPATTSDVASSDPDTANADVTEMLDVHDGADTVAIESAGLTEGESAWRGRIAYYGYGLLAEVALINTGGDLTATVVLDDDPEASAGFGRSVYTLAGTHEPRSGRLALAPEAWLEAPALQLELLGVEGTFDPDTGTLTVAAIDYASGNDNSQANLPGSLTLVSGDGAPTAVGVRAQALATGLNTFSGNMQCSGPSREVEGTLNYDGEGQLSGTIVVGGPGITTPLGTFEFVGIHNPDTGSITLTPRLWLDKTGSEPLTFFVDGTFNAETGDFEGGLRTNTSACPNGPWSVNVTH